MSDEELIELIADAILANDSATSADAMAAAVLVALREAGVKI